MITLILIHKYVYYAKTVREKEIANLYFFGLILDSKNSYNFKHIKTKSYIFIYS
jgi:hypothetical protein